MIVRLRLYILLVLFLGLNAAVNAQVSAGFNIIIPNSNCNPAVYSFVNTSTGAGLTYQWNFGVYQGVNSVFQNPSTTYLNCGTYLVKLVAIDSTGARDSVTQTVNIRCSPKAQFTASASTGCIPFNSGFNSTSIPGSGNIVRYSWDFGDGNGDTTNNPNHTFLVGGCKNVTLLVTNTYGCSNDTTINDVVCVNPQPVSSFTSSAHTNCHAPFNVTYQATSGGSVAPYSYQWIFQGGTPATSTAASPAVVYQAPGSYTTTLITTDGHGCTDTSVQVDYIFVASDVAAFTIDTNPHCAPAKVLLTADSTAYTSSWNWSVSQPGILGPNGRYTNTMNFNQSGNYDICLTINYTNGCSAQKCVSVYVSSPPTANFGVSGLLNTCLVPQPITFSDSSTGGGLSYHWSFPGGTPSFYDSAAPPIVSYNQCGHYSANLTVTNTAGCTSSYFMPDFLNIACNVASYTVTPATGCLPLTASFNSDASTGNPVAWNWNFDDAGSGTDTSTLQNPTHVFNDPGCHTVVLTTTTAEGCVYVDSIVAGVCGGFRPHANFSGNPPMNCANKPIFFKDSSTNEYSYTNYYWNFHQATPFTTESTDPNPSYTYNQPGVWDVTLIVSNYNCADTITKDSYVQTVVPVAKPSVSANCGNPLSVTLDGSASEGAQTYKWIIIGGTPDSSANATVVASFPGPGSYNASLYVQNDSTGCDDLGSVVVNITGPEAEFSASPRRGCAPLHACFSNSSTIISNYIWRITNDAGTFDSTFTGASPCFEFLNAGLYNVSLVTGDSSGCVDTVYKPHYIEVSAPVALFNAQPVSGCAPLTVNFNDLSTFQEAGISNWKWNFGDIESGPANTSALQNASHVYDTAGNYTVQLTITDSNGCVNNNTKLNYILVDKPKVSFTSTNVSSCLGVKSCFTSSASNTGLHYQWIFGDTTTANTVNPCHLYSHSGNYNVSLIGTDGAGCTDTITQIDTVLVVIPHPAFVADTTSATCPPLSVSFTNLTTGFDPEVTWYWRFGDGQVSTLQNPFHIYATPGEFTVTLIASVPNGCVDSAVYTNYIKISGPIATLAAPPTGGCVPHELCMHAFSTNTVSYTWDFGDGTVIPGSDSICYTYTRTGNFYAQLVLDNGLGCIFALPLGNIDVNGLIADFDMDRPVLCGPGTVQFTDSSYGTSVVKTSAWNFGDPASGALNVSSLLNPTHYYAAPGHYRVVENIVSLNGCADSAVRTVIINRLPHPSVQVNSPVNCGTDSVLFSAQTSSSSSLTSLLWNFGDPASGNANSATGQSVAHFYAASGTYNVTITVTDANGCSADSVHSLTVHQRPGSLFTSNSACINSQPINFTNNSLNATSYSWNFGDGTQSTLLNPSHTYLDTGKYTVELITRNAFCADTLNSPVNIFSLPVPAFSLGATSYCGAPVTIAINNTSTNAVGFLWNFGNNTSSTLKDPTADFASAGQFNVLLTAISSHGCHDTISHNISIHEKPTASFTPASVCLNDQPINFINEGQSGTDYVWSFGDGSTSSVVSPSHTYQDTGVFSVTLISETNYCSDTVKHNVQIFSIPVANFTLLDSAKCGPDAQFAITNQSTNATSYIWNFGNGATSSITEPVAVYSAAGKFAVQLIAKSDHGCMDTISKPVTVYPSPTAPDINISSVEGCQPLTVTISGNTYNASAFTWNFGTGAVPLTSNSANASFTYTDTGSYTLSLYMISDHQCTDTITMNDTIKVHIVPKAAFDTVINTSGYPYDGIVSFLNLSQNASSYVWSFGDGTTSNEFAPTHTYEHINTYSAQLIANTSYGCSDTAFQTFLVIRKALYVPNAIQPDYQGSQDLVKVWKPIGDGLLSYHARVFDKWGELMWESDQIKDWQPVDSWDGTYMGKPCQQDVYVWKINAVFLDGSVWPGMTYDKNEGGGTKTMGSITLIR